MFYIYVCSFEERLNCNHFCHLGIASYNIVSLSNNSEAVKSMERLTSLAKTYSRVRIVREFQTICSVSQRD